MGDIRGRRRSLPIGATRVALFLFTLLSALSGWRPVFAAGPNHAVVFVVDSSERMAPYLSAVKGSIFTFMDQSKPGYTLGIISFSDNATRLVVRNISNPRDTQSVTSRLDAIEAAGEAGDVVAGVVRALDEVAQLRRKGEKGPKGIIIISSSKSPDESRPGERLAAALSELSQQVSGKEWYIQYCYLNGVVDPELEAFVSANYGVSHDIDAVAARKYSEPVEELYQAFSTPSKLNPPRILDISRAVLGKSGGSKEWVPLKAGTEISEKMHIRVATDSRAVVLLPNLGKIGLAPETHLTLLEARKNPLTDKGRFNIRLEAGSIWTSLKKNSPIRLILTTTGTTMEPSGQAAAVSYLEELDELSLTSFSDNLSVKIEGKLDGPIALRKNCSVRLARGQALGNLEPAEPTLVEKWKSWRRALVNNIALAHLDFTAPEIIFPLETISLGPMESKEVARQEFALQIRGVDNPEKLKIDIQIPIELPDGLALSTSITEGENPNSRILTLKVDGSAGFRSRRSETHTGLIRLLPAQDSKVLFEKIVVPLSIATKGPLVPPSVMVLGAGMILFIVAAVVAGRMVRSQSGLVTRPHAVIGRLIVVNDPTGGRVGTISLEELGTKSSRLSLVVGRDKGAEVRLRHTSVSATHCVLEASLVGGRLRTSIEPIEPAKVKVDGKTIRSRTVLSDGAQLEIGDFTYHFEDTQMYKKVEITRRNGRKITGILDVEGMDSEGFRLSPADAVSPSERARVKFSDIRYATFYRRVIDILSGTPRPMPKSGAMKRVELEFRKGNTISGYIQREYIEGRRRYVELLPLESGSDIDYTVVDYSAVVEKRFL